MIFSGRRIVNLFQPLAKRRPGERLLVDQEALSRDYLEHDLRRGFAALDCSVGSGS